MDRIALKLTAALLLGSALAGCSTATPSGDQANAQGTVKIGKNGSSSKGLAADLDVQVQNAAALRAKGDLAGATTILSQLMLVAPDNSNVVGEYGKCLVLQGRSKDALDFLKRAVQLSPGDWTFYSAMGVAYDQSGDYASARVAYLQALSIKPGEASVLNNLALSRMQAKDLAGAHKYMAEAQAAGASNPKIAQNRALLASLDPTQAEAAPAPAKPQPAKAMTVQAPSKPLGPDVVMQAVPKDPEAGPVRKASAAPRKLAKDVPPAAPAKQAEAAAAKKKSAPAANQTPALRMTADVSTP
jgi:Flp pilus assembly protein TadD